MKFFQTSTINGCLLLPLLIGSQYAAAQTVNGQAANAQATGAHAAPGPVDGDPAVTETSSATVYAAAHFTRSQPTSAYDMIVLLPGFRLQEGDTSLRGYSGAGGKILVDGQRPSSKQDTLEDILKRIPAQMVERIELVRSSSSGFDMQGFPLIANVVRNSRGSLSGRVELESGFYTHGYRTPRAAGQLSYGAGSRQLDLSGAVYRKIDDEHGFGTRNRIAANGTPLRIADYEQPEGSDIREVSGSYRQGLAGGTIRLNGLAKTTQMFANIVEHVRLPQIIETSGGERVQTDATEFGFNYARPLSARSQIELIGIRRSTNVDGTDTSIYSGGIDQTRKNSAARETILRAVARRQGGIVSLEAGVEGAINSLDSHSALEQGGIDIPLPAANVRVEEKRAEFFVTSTWQLASALSLEVGTRYEASRLKQSGDSAMTKSLAYLKPRGLLRWSASPRNEFRLLVEREVGQLDFRDFVGSASLTSGTITAGNRNLEPDSLWRAELAWEHRIAGGSIVFTARHEAVSDVVDRIPVFVGGNVFDAVGNIGSGRREELQIDLNMPLDRVGLTGVTVQGNALFRHSRVTDPSTGTKRRISEDKPREAKVSLTYDMPQAHMRLGVNYVLANEKAFYKINEVERDSVADRIDAFVEYKPTPRWTMRVYGKNLTNSTALRIRDRYNGLRGTASLNQVETRVLNVGRYFGINIQRSFGQ